MNKLPEEAFLSIRKQYLDVLSNLNAPESVITDKLPFELFIHWIYFNGLYLRAKIIHMKRDARAICWSIYKSNFITTGTGYGEIT